MFKIGDRVINVGHDSHILGTVTDIVPGMRPVCVMHDDGDTQWYTSSGEYSNGGQRVLKLALDDDEPSNEQADRFNDGKPLTQQTTRDPSSNYYDAGGIDTLDIIKAKLTPEQYKGFLHGNALKYLSRMNFKHDDVKRDLEKAKFYLQFLSEVIE